MNELELAKKMYDHAFSPQNFRFERSTAYKNGVKRGIALGLKIYTTHGCRYKEGTAQCDAYFAGIEEGRRCVLNWNHPDPEIQKLAGRTA